MTAKTFTVIGKPLIRRKTHLHLLQFRSHTVLRHSGSATQEDHNDIPFPPPAIRRRPTLRPRHPLPARPPRLSNDILLPLTALHRHLYA